MSDTPDTSSTPTLTGRIVELRPLRANDAQNLLDAAADGELWNLKVTVVPQASTVDAYLARAHEGERAGTVMPFAIVRRDTGRVVGSTRFWKIDRVNRKLEIGHTWLAASAQRSAVNTEAKYLLLTYAFETLHCVRVQFMIHDRRVQREIARGDPAPGRKGRGHCTARTHHAGRAQAQFRAL